MNWSKGFTATYYAYEIDPVTRREIDRIQIMGGTISHGDDGLRNSANLSVKGYEGDNEKWIRVYLDTNQGGASSHVPIFTGLATSPERDIDGTYVTETLECYSVLKPAQDIMLEKGYYAPAEISGATLIQSLLSVCPAEVVSSQEAPSLQNYIIAEEGETNLSMVDKILEAINWRMRIQGDGTIELSPKPIEPVIVLDPLKNDMIEPSLSVTRDWFNCPNVLRAYAGDLTAIAKDENPDSPLSIQARGREVWAEETNVTLNSGEGIAEYVVRRLKELQKISLQASYQRRFNPVIIVGDLIQLHYPEQGLDGTFRVLSQKIDISYGARTAEDVEYYE